eukprot:PLAT6188.1.p1 GENE.PLAT6188.1~~PLAT6188.1.p1  ORF type:complete len:464 (-),score=206.86 PLAT6188.1:75-1466(-)
MAEVESAEKSEELQLELKDDDEEVQLELKDDSASDNDEEQPEDGGQGDEEASETESPAEEAKGPAKPAAREPIKRPAGFATGFDVYSEEEEAKRAARAAKYGIPLRKPDMLLKEAMKPRVRDEDWQAEEEEKKEAVRAAERKARAERFGMPLYDDVKAQREAASISKRLREQRRDLLPGEERRLDALHVYGTDRLDTDDLMNYFSIYGATGVEWINDSSANVLFGDKFSATRALRGTTEEIPPLPAEDLAVDDTLECLNRLGWRRGIDFIKKKSDRWGRSGSKARLLMRLAGVGDRKGFGKTFLVASSQEVRKRILARPPRIRNKVTRKREREIVVSTAYTPDGRLTAMDDALEERRRRKRQKRNAGRPPLRLPSRSRAHAAPEEKEEEEDVAEEAVEAVAGEEEAGVEEQGSKDDVAPEDGAAEGDDGADEGEASSEQQQLEDDAELEALERELLGGDDEDE